MLIFIHILLRSNQLNNSWSVVESKVEHIKFLEKETLIVRSSEASNSLKLSDFRGFV